MNLCTGKIVRFGFATVFSALVFGVVFPPVVFAEEAGTSAPGESTAAPAVTQSESTGTTSTAAPAVTPTESKSTNTSTSQCAEPNKIFLQFIEAVTGKTSTPEVCDLMQNVVSLKRVGDSVELTKSDNSKVMVSGNTHFGATVIGGFSDVRQKVADKFGEEVGKLIDEFVGVTSTGSHLEVIREGPEIEDIDLSERKVKKQLPLRRVRLSKMSLDVEMIDGHPALKNITGVEAVPNSGLEIPFVLKEFSRTKNKDGDDVFTFGVKNPFPIMKPFKRLLGIKEIVPITWTVKKPESKEIGAKESPEHKE